MMVGDGVVGDGVVGDGVVGVVGDGVGDGDSDDGGGGNYGDRYNVEHDLYLVVPL
jgi:hypothetical protein